VRAVARLVGRWQRRRATLRTLAELDATTLRDIGVDPSEVGSVAAELGGHVAASRRRTELDHFLSASSRLRVSRVDACL
jgi:uncharacterized protein YjiS (DUF1127 family)